MRFEHVGGVVCLGETMVMMVPAEPGPVHLVRTWHRAVGGAESNVAMHLVRLGVPSSWVSAVGDDSFGLAVLDTVGGFGVDVSQVRIDATRPTGLYVKEASPHGSPVRYYRRGSAASGMGPEMIRKAAADPGFLAGVLDYIAADESLLIAFAQHAGVKPQVVERAHMLLGGQLPP